MIIKVRLIIFGTSILFTGVSVLSRTLNTLSPSPTFFMRSCARRHPPPAALSRQFPCTPGTVAAVMSECDLEHPVSFAVCLGFDEASATTAYNVLHRVARVRMCLPCFFVNLSNMWTDAAFSDSRCVGGSNSARDRTDWPTSGTSSNCLSP